MGKNRAPQLVDQVECPIKKGRAGHWDAKMEVSTVQQRQWAKQQRRLESAIDLRIRQGRALE